MPSGARATPSACASDRPIEPLTRPRSFAYRRYPKLRTSGGPMTIATTLLAADVVERFRQDGFVVVPDLLSADEVARYGAAVTAAVRRRRAGDDRPLAEK